MNRLVCFLMVGLAFTVLQISTVAAQAPTPPPADTFAQPPADPMGDAPGGPPTGAPDGPPMGDPNMPPAGQ